MPAHRFSILGDSPVGTDRDRLNFTTFVEPFAERLIGSAANSPFTVGIFADWGQGKSTVMQMLRTALRKRECPTIWFEPWKHNTREAVWKGLALTLVMEIRREAAENPSLRKELARKQGGLKSFFAKAVWAPLIGREWAQDLVEAVQKEPWSPSLLHEFEENLETLFALIHPAGKAAPANPLVLFVDDLDRCLPDAALAVLEALKLVLSRPGLITVMGIAEDELSRSVLAGYGKEMKDAELPVDPAWGRKYIRKIIQMPFPIPYISEKSFDQYISSCLEDSNVGPTLAKDPARWLEIIREACESNLREVKRFINHYISEIDKASANTPASAVELDPPRVAFVLLLGWRFGTFLTYIRKQAGERDLLVRYQIFFSQYAPGVTPDPSILAGDQSSEFRQDILLRTFFNRCLSGESPLVLPFTDWNDIEPYLQFGIRSPKSAVAAPVIVTPPPPAAQTAAPAPATATVVIPPPQPAAAPAATMASATPTAPAPPSETAREVAARVQSLFSSGRLEEALGTAMSAITIMSDIRDSSGEAVLWDLAGSIYQAQNRTSEADAAYQHALEIARNSGLQRESIGFLLNLARLHLLQEDSGGAIKFALEGLKTARDIGDPLSEANALVDLADALRDQGDLAGALERYQDARGIYLRLNFPQGQLAALGRLSLMNVERDPLQARAFNTEATAIAERLGDKIALLRLLSNRAHIEQSIGESISVTEDSYKRAIKLAQELGNHDEAEALDKELADFTRHKHDAVTLDHEILVPPQAKFKPRPKQSSPGRRLK